MTSTTAKDASERTVLTDIEEFGWHCVNILAEGERGPYSFTVGLFKTFGHPELIIFGLRSEVAHSILTIVADAVKRKEPISLSEPTDALIENLSCCFAEVPVSQYYEHVGFCRWCYQGNDFPLHQIIWPSSNGLFPWHPNASTGFKALQPVIAGIANDT